MIPTLWSKSNRCCRPTRTSIQSAWSDKELGGEAHVDWYPFDHPQLGRVELGGWNRLACFRNPPRKFLEREVARFPKWLTWQALTTPKLELLRTEVEKLGNDA